jgi:hypothetical protein
MQEKYYVIAGNAQQATDFIKRKATEMWHDGYTSIALSNFVYVSSVLTLRGIRNPHGFFIGTWRDRRDIHEILYQLLILVHETETIEKLSKLKNELESKR